MKNWELMAYGPHTIQFANNNCVGLVVHQTISPGVGEQISVERANQEVTDPHVRVIAERVKSQTQSPFSGKSYVRLRADRDIRPEDPGNNDAVGENGENATRFIEHYLHQSACHNLVEDHIISDLNVILHPDWAFTRIFPKREGGTWELWLEDKEKRLVPLSHTGSGVKTILLVLINLHLVPHKNGRPLSDYVFCFEELENNLHPAVQRRLFRFLRDKAVESKCIFFVTTHSNSVIDLFSQDAKAQLLHVLHDGKRSVIQQVSSYLHQCAVLDDLDVRASDLLQANVLVWVEGPSDRIYFNRWVELWSEGQIREHTHYQCVWYGGSLLADVSFESDETLAHDRTEAFVAALKVNRRAVVIMDSDRRKAGDKLKERVIRISHELQGVDGFAWVTAGREVENYIPLGPLRAIKDNESLSLPKQYDDVFEKAGLNRKRKVELAHSVSPLLSKQMLESIHDLSIRLDEVCKLIRAWNGLPEGAKKDG